MIISHKHKFIYIKGGRVAGTTIEIFFENFCGDNDIVGARGLNAQHGPGLPKCLIPEVRKSTSEAKEKLEWWNHMPARMIKNKLQNDQQWKTYFKFGATRNPWDREVSAYCSRYHSNDPSHKAYTKGTPLSESVSHAGPLSFLYKDKGAFALDDYIRFEDLNNEIKRICNKLNLPFNKELIGHHKGEHRDPQKHYTEYYDHKTRLSVAKRYKEDIKYFGYEFGE